MTSDIDVQRVINDVVELMAISQPKRDSRVPYFSMAEVVSEEVDGTVTLKFSNATEDVEISGIRKLMGASSPVGSTAVVASMGSDMVVMGVNDDGSSDAGLLFAQQTADLGFGEPGMYALSSASPLDGAWVQVDMTAQVNDWRWGVGTESFDPMFKIEAAKVSEEDKSIGLSLDMDDSLNSRGVNWYIDMELPDPGSSPSVLEFFEMLASVDNGGFFVMDITDEYSNLSFEGVAGQTQHLVVMSVGSADWFLTNTLAMGMEEQVDPPAPAANTGYVYMRDNGAGKTQMCVKFNTGAVQVIATQP